MEVCMSQKSNHVSSSLLCEKKITTRKEYEKQKESDNDLKGKELSLKAKLFLK